MKAGKLAIRPWLICQYNENTLMELPSSVQQTNITQPDLTLFYLIILYHILLTCEVDIFEVLEIMAQMWHCIIF